MSTTTDIPKSCYYCGQNSYQSFTIDGKSTWLCYTLSCQKKWGDRLFPEEKVQVERNPNGEVIAIKYEGTVYTPLKYEDECMACGYLRK